MNSLVGGRLDLRPFVFWLCLVTPSLHEVVKYTGTAGLLVYIGTVGFAVLAISRWNVVPHMYKVTDRQLLILALLTALMIWTVFSVLYPIANSGLIGPGSDADDALNKGVTYLLAGQYPYYAETYLGNPINQLPGSLLLAAPFVLLGTSAYQNLFWLAAVVWAASRILGSLRLGIGWFWFVLALSPVVWQELVAGTDHLANALFVLVLAFLVVYVVPQKNIWRGWKLAAAILFGLGLSSRPNFLVLVPLILSALGQRSEWKQACGYVAATMLAFVAITIPFYLYDPGGFSPQYTINRIGQFDRFIPGAGVVVPSVVAISSIVLAMRQCNGKWMTLLRNAAITQGMFVAFLIIGSIIEGKEFDLGYANYGLFFLFFGALACWCPLVRASNEVFSDSDIAAAAGLRDGAATRQREKLA